ncbi:PREDICTED: uncharacterized protein LOC107343632 isoform X1 [Acropora digitifera]|uniref:uncharacterized protein LOC107343632 isoform X1 n=1 Tax=Acropora digitifera TaxID=70779 RepID=UPI00077A639D|nr:PREDICTED: uncharacterized protein LOC107343632 isoform X1 [Acropora digitifera]
MKRRHLAVSLFLVGLFIICVGGSIPSGKLKKDILKHSVQSRSEEGENTVKEVPQMATSKADKSNMKEVEESPAAEAPQKATSKGDKSNKKKDVDECKQKKIQQICKRKGKMCTNTLGSYRCDCGRGFYSDRRICKDKDECKAGIHNCSKRIYCQNTRGSFNCVCPKGHDKVTAFRSVDCVATDFTRWTTFEYFLRDLKAGVLTRIAATGAAGLIVLLLLILSLVCLMRRAKRKKQERELKRLAYTEQLMIAAGLVDPNEMFYPDQGGYGQGGAMYYPPEPTAQPQGNVAQPQGNVAQPMGDPMGNYAQDNMSYAEDMGYAMDTEPSSNPMPYEDIYVPHTYYEDDQPGSDDEGY